MAQPSIRVYFEPEIHAYFEARRKRLKLSQTEFYKNLIMNSHMSHSLDEVHSNLEEVVSKLGKVNPTESGGVKVHGDVIRSIFFMESLLTIAMNKPEAIRQANHLADKKMDAISVESL
jgi:hypothetical protein